MKRKRKRRRGSDGDWLRWDVMRWDKMRQDKTSQDGTRHDVMGRDRMRWDETKQDGTAQDETRWGETRCMWECWDNEPMQDETDAETGRANEGWVDWRPLHKLEGILKYRSYTYLVRL
jgi:pentapeptide MXKDX repeat protein